MRIVPPHYSKLFNFVLGLLYLNIIIYFKHRKILSILSNFKSYKIIDILNIMTLLKMS